MNKVGQRVCVEDQFGTVLFGGPVPAQSSKIWLGIEWDDPARGKHDGTHEGVQYFKCRFGSLASFVKPSDRVCFGRSLIDAAQEKYGFQPLLEAASTFGDTSISVQMYGFDKIQSRQKDLDTLTIVGLADMKISSAGDIGQSLKNKRLFQKRLRVQDLDLSKNLLSSWQDVLKICHHMKQLSSLRLNFNRFLSLDASSYVDGTASLKTLSLNHTLITWSQVQTLEKYLPNIEELHLGSNGLVTFDGTWQPAEYETKFTKLKMLNLEANQISDWQSSVEHLSKLRNLQTLNVQNNKLTKITYSSGFNALTTLNISSNAFVSVADVRSLENFPVLEQLRFNDATILKNLFELEIKTMTPRGTWRLIFTSFLSRLTNYNGSAISKKDRGDAELYYLNLCLAEANRRKFPLTAMDDHFPRYDALVSIHGAPLETKAAQTNLKQQFLDVELQFETNSFTRKLPGHMTITQLKNITSRLFHVPNPDQQFEIVLASGHTISHENINEMRDLSFYVTEEKCLIKVSKI